MKEWAILCCTFSNGWKGERKGRTDKRRHDRHRVGETEMVAEFVRRVCSNGRHVAPLSTFNSRSQLIHLNEFSVKMRFSDLDYC